MLCEFVVVTLFQVLGDVGLAWWVAKALSELLVEFLPSDLDLEDVGGEGFGGHWVSGKYYWECGQMDWIVNYVKCNFF